MYGNSYQPTMPNAQDLMQRIGQLNQYTYPQQQGQMQSPQQQYAQPQAQPTSNVSWVMVNGIDGARNVTVQPNSKVWLMDNNDQIFYLKQSDSMGVCDLKAFRFNEVNVNAPVAPVAPDTNSFVSREEFEALKSKIETYEQSQTVSATKATTKKKDGVDNG